MENQNQNLNKGIIFGILGIIFIGFQPIVANSRPMILDSYFFAAMTVFVEASIFFPLMLIERSKIKKRFKNEEITLELRDSLLHGYKENKLLLFCVGATFGVGQILFFVGYGLSGSINGSLAQKSTIFFSLVFGLLILNEKISKTQVFFSLCLFFGLILSVTQGSFNLLELNVGVLILLLLSSMWMLAHTYTKKYVFDRNQATPTQMVFMRNMVGAIILMSTYFLFFPIENLNLLLEPINLLWGFWMGATYSTGLYCWYKTLQYLDVSKASILVSPTPIATAIYATLLLGEVFTIYHLIGTSIVIFSVIMVVRKKKENK